MLSNKNAESNTPKIPSPDRGVAQSVEQGCVPEGCGFESRHPGLVRGSAARDGRGSAVHDPKLDGPRAGGANTRPPKRGDVVYTPDWVALDMCASFEPSGRVLEPCKGEGVFLNYLPDAEWCEITEGRDFFDWHEEVDWVVGNPPYSMTRKWFRHSMAIAEHLLYLVPLRNVFSGYGFLREIHDFGGMAAIRCYGTGGRLGFPMGNAVGAMHIVRGYRGGTWITHYDTEVVMPLFSGAAA